MLEKIKPNLKAILIFIFVFFLMAGIDIIFRYSNITPLSTLVLPTLLAILFTHKTARINPKKSIKQAPAVAALIQIILGGTSLILLSRNLSDQTGAGFFLISIGMIILIFVHALLAFMISFIRYKIFKKKQFNTNNL